MRDCCLILNFCKIKYMVYDLLVAFVKMLMWSENFNASNFDQKI